MYIFHEILLTWHGEVVAENQLMKWKSWTNQKKGFESSTFTIRECTLSTGWVLHTPKAFYASINTFCLFAATWLSTGGCANLTKTAAPVCWSGPLGKKDIHISDFCISQQIAQRWSLSQLARECSLEIEVNVVNVMVNCKSFTFLGHIIKKNR